jgi:hypothetical protein
MRSTGCAEEKPHEHFPAEKSTAAIHSGAVAGQAQRARGTTYTSSAGLLPFDGVFD